MNIKYICPFWGCEKDTLEIFIEKVVQSGYDGIEINLPASGIFTNRLGKVIEDIGGDQPGFVCILQQLTTPQNENIDTYIRQMEMRLHELAALQPALINSHTGKDFFSFDDNCRAIEAASNITAKTGVRILHETHRGRFSFHAASLVSYLEKFPELELVGDFSHFCVVSESMLQDQQEIIGEIIPHVSHIHARVGSEQSPQVNDPAAPEWQSYLDQFTAWWQQIIDHKRAMGISSITITPEFGPAPYMPSLPFTQHPTTDQWAANTFMMNYLRQKLK